MVARGEMGEIKGIKSTLLLMKKHRTVESLHGLPETNITLCYLYLNKVITDKLQEKKEKVKLKKT